MKILINIIINGLIIMAIILSEQFGVKPAYNLAMFSLWFIIICGFLMMFVPAKEIFRDAKESYITSYIGLILVLLIVYYGWLVTASFLAFAELIIFSRKKEHFTKAVTE